MPSSPNPKTGEIWDVTFDPVVGHEQGGFRPGLVISNDQFNETPHGLCLVAPFTGTDRGVPSHVPVAVSEGGLTKPSVVMCEQVRSVSVLRFRRRRGMLSPGTLDLVQATVGMFIDR
ncbi:MAG: type II toxin-antitoxin system PemK/MazF family toxin [Chloroflexota bacterium]|nr:type II toxin-antitoxin system PemK/MazF family toxin [Chloroflexota bacterium]